jgi:type IV secretion system protein VirB6
MAAYNVKMPIQWLIDTVNDSASHILIGVSKHLIENISAIGVAGLGIYVILMMFSYMRGSETLPIMDFFMKMVSWAIIIGYGLNAQSYTSNILPLVTGLGSGLAQDLTGAQSGYSALDTMTVNYINVISIGLDNLRAMSIWDSIFPAILFFLKSILILVGVVPFLVVAVSFTLLANVGSQIVAAIGPLFFLFLLFPATRQYFSSWLNTAFSYALIPTFIGIISLLASGISMQIMGLKDNGSGNAVTLVDTPLENVIVAAIANFVFIFLLMQVASIASSLSAGGINAGMASAGSAIMGGAKGVAGEIKGVGDRKESKAARRESQISRAESQQRRGEASANANNKIKGG